MAWRSFVDNGLRSLGRARASPLRLNFRYRLQHEKNTKPKEQQSSEQSWLKVAEERPFSELTVAEKVVETSKDVGSIGVIVLGLGLAGAFLGGLAYELFKAQTPESIQKSAMSLLQTDMRVSDLVGGEVRLPKSKKNEIKHAEYRVGNMDFLRIEFPVTGNIREAVVKLEMKRPMDKSEPYKYRYLLVQCGNQRVVLEDNRSEDRV